VRRLLRAGFIFLHSLTLRGSGDGLDYKSDIQQQIRRHAEELRRLLDMLPPTDVALADVPHNTVLFLKDYLCQNRCQVGAVRHARTHAGFGSSVKCTWRPQRPSVQKWQKRVTSRNGVSSLSRRCVSPRQCDAPCLAVRAPGFLHIGRS